MKRWSIRAAIRPEEHAVFRADKMGKATLFESERILVGLNCFEPGQQHALHAHVGLDKVYQVLAGQGEFLLEGRAIPMEAGLMLVAPEGVPHGIRNNGSRATRGARHSRAGYRLHDPLGRGRRRAEHGSATGCSAVRHHADPRPGTPSRRTRFRGRLPSGAQPCARIAE